MTRYLSKRRSILNIVIWKVSCFQHFKKYVFRERMEVQEEIFQRNKKVIYISFLCLEVVSINADAGWTNYERQIS